MTSVQRLAFGDERSESKAEHVLKFISRVDGRGVGELDQFVHVGRRKDEGSRRIDANERTTMP